ncbi:hypothetical protein [Mycobacterium seoulense]|uniref:hypothetical protein n=1 Tax=Mycobacterium seoulense TaxID=386911 RepID=UPI003CEC1DDA
MTTKAKWVLAGLVAAIVLIGVLSWYNSPSQKLHRCVEAQENNGKWFPATVKYEHFLLVSYCQGHLDNYEK